MHILITGASSGIGAAMAQHWGRTNNCKISLAARREDALVGLTHTMRCNARAIRSDLSVPGATAELHAAAVEAFGPIDILVNNAGIQYVEPTAGVSADRAERLLRVDLLAPLELQNLVLPGMLERRTGTIVNVASMAGITPTPGMSHYNAAKSGLAAASESLRVELRGSGVNVLTVYPGPVTTPMEQEARDSYADTFALRFAPTGDAHELARLIERAVDRRRARLVYPRIYGIARYFRVAAQWITNVSAPPLVEK